MNRLGPHTMPIAPGRVAAPRRTPGGHRGKIFTHVLVIHLLILENDLQFATNPAFIEPVRAALDLRRNTPLSQAAMEVLAVIAYNQPVTKAFVEQVRGVDCSGVIGSLTLKGLIEERGRLELPGRPLLYGTTDAFLRCLNIRSLADLPPLPKNEEAAEQEAPADGGAEA